MFFVKSRSGSGEWKVDKERRMGLGECECPNAQKGGNHECWHLRRVNAMMACEEAQRQMRIVLTPQPGSATIGQRGEQE